MESNYWIRAGSRYKFCLRQDGRHFEYFSREVREIRHGEDKEGLQDPGVAGEPGDESGDESPDDADDGSSQGDDEKGGEAFENVVGTQVVLADLRVGLEHVVQHLNKRMRYNDILQHYYNSLSLT